MTQGVDIEELEGLPLEELQQRLEAVNEIMRSMGMPEFKAISPNDCIPQDVNARYMKPEVFDNLVSNITNDGHLESLPLVTPAQDQEDKFGIISGHHRILAAQKAELEFIIVMSISVETYDELVAKQLSHNAITGDDDAAVLKKMYESLSDVSAKYYSGLEDDLASMSLTTLSFRSGIFQEFTVAFMPEDVTDFDDKVAQVEEYMKARGSTVVRVANSDDHDDWLEAIKKIKKVEDIKNNAVAIGRMLELAMERLQQLHQVDDDVFDDEPVDAPPAQPNGNEQVEERVAAADELKKSQEEREGSAGSSTGGKSRTRTRRKAGSKKTSAKKK